MFERINLQQKLRNLKNKQVSEQELMAQVKAILDADGKKEKEILERIQDSEESEENDFILDLLETDRIFHISHIKSICIDYRLRFLNTKYFKSQLPQEALFEIKKLEKQHQTDLKAFKIMAPSKHFKLENADDPILFSPIGNNYYYLIHKWGQDLHPLRKMLMWPLRDFENLLIFSIAFSFLFTFVIRELFFSQFQKSSEFLVLFMFTFKSVIALIFFYGIALGKNFNSSIWKSKYYNA